MTDSTIKEPKKATDILLDLTSKVDILLGIVQSQDLNIKILSNKLNALMEVLNQQANNPVPTMEAVHTKQIPQMYASEKYIPISAENRIPEEKNPQGFRRTSRPETYTNQDVYAPTTEKIINQSKVPAVAEIRVPATATEKSTFPTQDKNKLIEGSTIPVIQRILDKDGKSVFLANVDIINKDNGQVVNKTKTNGVGKWQAALNPGSYKVIIKKREPLTQRTLEVNQDIIVDGNKSPLSLSNYTLK